MESTPGRLRPGRSRTARGAVAPVLAAIAAACIAWTTTSAAASPGSATPRTAAASNAPSPLAGVGPQLQRWIEESAASTWTTRLPGDGDDDSALGGVRVEVKVGRLNPGMRLAPCAHIEPFLPSNAKLWGRTYVGVRCVEGATWSTMIPVTVSVYGPALVANLPMPMGTLPRPDDFRIEEVDWTRSAGVPVSDPGWLEGRSLGRPLSAGQVLRANDLRVPQTVSAGDPVRIRMVGTGFSVSSSGFAMAAAGEGQSLRVRTETGRMLVGTVRDRTVEIRL